MLANSYKHGHSAASVNGPRRISSEYRSWAGMIQRCYNPNNKAYRYYGARGVSVCKRWRESFCAFISDMGRKPKNKQSIDRIDTYGNYTPKNCRWATTSQQVRNQRPRRFVNQKVRVDSSTGIKNIILARDKEKRYRAYARINKRRIHLGYFATIKQAQVAIERATA